MSNRSITLTDADGAVVSILEIPEHATSLQDARISSAAFHLACARGFRINGYRPSGPPNRDPMHVCRCQSGGVCDVPHDPGACDCRQCVTAEAAEAFASDGSP